MPAKDPAAQAATARAYRARKRQESLGLLDPVATPLRNAPVDREVRAAAKAVVEQVAEQLGVRPASVRLQHRNAIASMSQAQRDAILARMR